MQRVLFIDRMRPEDAPAVARIWTEHDGTGLPERIGVVNRTLYRFHGLYVHMVEARDDLPGDLTERIFAARTDPAFVDTRDRLAAHLEPYLPEFRNLKDTRAEQFYRWQA
ncbi:TcmI family type II polyketide cyclase [Actinomadura nitritigenes]|uniref:TcmI family type II polyketide cyclase n=1 Tax=Actinomadura nitritigenes TaxID=134602 RepID=A0ABS3QUE8_9ACTN|nr:TcmI family type II polyketide cyclase [Actinomadura nitritigenes]MBO2437594.1 TcmI family type II polyketide cyclase [Actinomadura nitritigenes]